MLNQLQKKVVYTNEPFLFLLAGAGTGKTRVIVERIKHLVSTGVSPDKILAITFTNRASNEMRERVKNENIAIHTFHQFCFQKLKEHLDYSYHIISEDIPIKEESLLLITRYKNSFYRQKKPKEYHVYQSILVEKNEKDFDDLLIDFHHHFHKLKRYVNYDYIFIDEFQDTNYLQYMIIKKLITKKTNVLCVGDPDQSIYKFRGAHAQIINSYIKDYQAKVLKLTMNYRSTNHILTLANSLIKRNNNRYKKILVTDNNHNYKQFLIESLNENDESKYVCKCIEEHLKKGVTANDIAVLFRNHNRCYTLKEKMNYLDIAYHDNSANSVSQKAINLLTLHQAKGLEFSVVFIIGLEQGSIPSYHAKTNLDLQEERRLFFVGMTRAKHFLYLSFVRFNNDSKHLLKSIFIKELKRDLLSYDKTF